MDKSGEQTFGRKTKDPFPRLHNYQFVFNLFCMFALSKINHYNGITLNNSKLDFSGYKKAVEICF